MGILTQGTTTAAQIQPSASVHYGQSQLLPWAKGPLVELSCECKLKQIEIARIQMTYSK